MFSRISREYDFPKIESKMFLSFKLRQKFHEKKYFMTSNSFVNFYRNSSGRIFRNCTRVSLKHTIKKYKRNSSENNFRNFFANLTRCKHSSGNISKNSPKFCENYKMNSFDGTLKNSSLSPSGNTRVENSYGNPFENLFDNPSYKFLWGFL